MVRKEVHRLPVLHSFGGAGKTKDFIWSCVMQPLLNIVKGGSRIALLWQRQWYVLEQPWVDWLLLVKFTVLCYEWSQLELQQWRCQSSEQQQQVQRLCGSGGSALNSEYPFLYVQRLCV